MAEKKEEETKQEETKQEVEEEQQESYLKDLLSISGHGGLFRFISQARNGIIVESLEDGKRMQAFASMKVSALEDIAIYTEDEEVRLDDIFIKIRTHEKGQEAISHKSGTDDLKDYFSAILPDYDKDRVYVSDIKKVLNWYNLLLKYDLLNFDEHAKKAREAGKEPQKPAATGPTTKHVQKTGKEIPKKASPKIAAGKKASPGQKKAPSR